MPDSGTQPSQQQPQGQQTDPPSPATTDDDAQKIQDSYWKRLEDTLDKRIDEAVKRHMPGRTSGPGQQRTGRSTLRDFLADIMGGPFPDPNKPKS